ncbi:MAG: Cell division initiation protein DivIVA [Ignavibacteriae bacterium]|nr:MAG: Cell division initiation protein DivIVA [Ignavibacteriota bacterium]
MKLTSIDLKKQEFKKVMRGYDPVEVDTFLSMIAEELDELQRSNKELQHKLTEVQTQLQDYKSMEKTLQATLMQAQDVSAKSIENAKKEGQLIIQDAELKAAQILDKARSEHTRLKEEIEILKAKKNTLAGRLKLLLNSELELIKALEVDEEIILTQNNEKDLEKENSEIDDIVKNINNED